MSWLAKLNETYDACFGREQFASGPLTPIDHVEQQAHLEIVLDEQGNFLRGAVVLKENTLIPATEASAGRTSGLVAHPLCDKLRYVAADYGAQEENGLYLQQLRAWAAHSGNAKLRAVLLYVERGTVVQDLLRAELLEGALGALRTNWDGDLSALARLLPPDPKTKKRDQGSALVRWRVELPDDKESTVWKDRALHEQWAAFNAASTGNPGLCFHSGELGALAESHPRRLRHGGDGAKLISANDKGGFTFRGRFNEAAEAYGLGKDATQKAHNALRWLIARQVARQGDQVIVAWAVGGDRTPLLTGSSEELFLDEEGETCTPAAEAAGYAGDAGQAFALRLRNAIGGYRSRLDDTADIVVMVLDSATPGRMAVLYYRELKSSEFLARIEHWHRSLAWP